MKNAIIILVLILFSGDLIAQKCRFKENTVDEFTGKKITSTREYMLTKAGLGLGTYATFQVRKVDEVTYLVFKAFAGSIFSVRKGDAIMFKMNDDEIINLEWTETEIASSNHIQQLNTTMWIVTNHIPLSQDVIDKLIEKEVVKARWYGSDGYFEKDVTKKNSKNLSEQLVCVINN